MLGRIASLLVALAVIAGCGWFAYQFQQVYRASIEAAPVISAAQAQAVEARAVSTAVILDAQGNYNYNNAAATAVIIDAQGNYIYNSAQATAVIADSNQGPVNIYKDGQATGQTQGAGAAFGLSFMGGMGAIIIILLVVLARR